LRDFAREKRVVGKMAENRPIKPMNTRLVKLALTLCLVSSLNLADSLRAQDTNADDGPQPAGTTNNGTPQPGSFGRRGGFGAAGFGGGGSMGVTEDSPIFDIQIEGGDLSLAPLGPLEHHPELTNFWAPGTKKVWANMNNISLYLRATDSHLSVILSPGTGSASILNLKIKTSRLVSLCDAISVASGNTIRGNPNPGLRGGGIGPMGRQFGESSVTFTSRDSDSHPSLEVFNLSGYIQTLYFQTAGHVDDKFISQKLDEVQNMVASTLRDMRIDVSSRDALKFKYHAGTKLLIVIGKPEAIEVTRKIINALSGQQTNGKAELLLDTPAPPSQN
jgi:hypothetical protein